MKITKDTEVAVDVSTCSRKERKLVIDVLKRFHKEDDLPDAEREASERAGYIDFNFMEDGWTWSEYNTPVEKEISFKKFLRSVNPYKGQRVYITGANKKTVKRAEKMGYVFVNDLNNSDIKMVQIGTCNSNDPHYGFQHNHSNHYEMFAITNEQFMNLEGITPPKPEPLKFQGYEVEVGAQSIRVGCQKVLLSDLEGFLQVVEIAENHNHFLGDIIDFIKENKERLGLT